MFICRRLGADISELRRNSGISHVQTLLILNVLIGKRGLSEERLSAICPAAVDVNAMPLLYLPVS